MIGAFEIGLLYAVVALGVYLTFRVLNFPDLTVDGSFVTGAAVATLLLTKGYNPALAMCAAFAAGMVAGAITGLLHTKLNIDGLLAGILMMIALWSVNLRILGLANGSQSAANVSLRSHETLLDIMMDAKLKGTWTGVLILFAGVLLIKLIIDWFLATDRGLALQATGNSEQMIRSFGVNTDNQKILGLALSNGLVALGGSLVAQYVDATDISLGVGVILVGLASVILGQAFFGNRRVWLATLGVVVGAVLYRLIVLWALQLGLENSDVRLMNAVIVVVAILIPQTGVARRLGLTSLFGRRRKAQVIGVDPGAETESSPATPAVSKGTK
ncbi:ABC transporter permease [Gulosibacter bifidus]|uniref:ABC transporter permease n=1 Tax=Gulosibacter bifidus TaxID=272239 RepID=A0ABW5RI28_9MICO|nr:ABC transporter permease [Gulosibacter bifidus]